MAIDLYKRIIGDKGSKVAGKTNNPLADYLLNEDEQLGFLNTNVITLNILFSGRADGGIPIGKVSMISADSKSGKSIISLALIKNAQAKGMTAVVLDTEYAFDYKVAEAFGVDISKEKLIVLPECGLEELQNIIAKLFEGLTTEESRNIFLVLDSWGGLVTDRIIDNALEGNTKKIMDEPQLKNKLASILNSTKATIFVVNHCYDNTGGIGDKLKIPGGKRLYYISSSVVLVVGRGKEKTADGNVTGYILSAKTHKSRSSMDTTELQFRIKQNGGLDIWYGLLDDALEGGFVLKSKPGEYYRTCIENDTPRKEKDIYISDFWLPIFKKTDFKKYIEKKYTYTSTLDVQTENIDELFENVEVKEEKIAKKSKKKVEEV